MGATALRCPRICPVYPSVALTMTYAYKEPLSVTTFPERIAKQEVSS